MGATDAKPKPKLSPVQAAQFEALQGMADRYSLSPQDMADADPETLARYLTRLKGHIPIDPRALSAAAKAYAAHKAQSPDPSTE